MTLSQYILTLESDQDLNFLSQIPMCLISATMMSWGRVWVDSLLTDSEVFFLFAENSQILVKISIILIFLTFMYLVTLYQKTEL